MLRSNQHYLTRLKAITVRIQKYEDSNVPVPGYIGLRYEALVKMLYPNYIHYSVPSHKEVEEVFQTLAKTQDIQTYLNAQKAMQEKYLGQRKGSFK